MKRQREEEEKCILWQAFWNEAKEKAVEGLLDVTTFKECSYCNIPFEVEDENKCVRDCSIVWCGKCGFNSDMIACKSCGYDTCGEHHDQDGICRDCQ